MAERWRARLGQILHHELSGRQPLILYAAHPHFEQTNAIGGTIGEGTGGVTESIRRRVILPLGGPEGHKGYGLSAMIEVFSGILPGLGFGVEPTGKHNDGVFMACFQVDAFRDLKTFKQEVTDFANYLKATPKAVGVDEIYYPGEIEHKRTQAQLKSGIDVEDKTWAELKALAEEYGAVKELGM